MSLVGEGGSSEESGSGAEGGGRSGVPKLGIDGGRSGLS